MNAVPTYEPATRNEQLYHWTVDSWGPAVQVMIQEQDFYDVTWAYLQTVAAQKVPRSCSSSPHAALRSAGRHLSVHHDAASFHNSDLDA